MLLAAFRPADGTVGEGPVARDTKTCLSNPTNARLPHGLGLVIAKEQGGQIFFTSGSHLPQFSSLKATSPL